MQQWDINHWDFFDPQGFIQKTRNAVCMSWTQKFEKLITFILGYNANITMAENMQGLLQKQRKSSIKTLKVNVIIGAENITLFHFFIKLMQLKYIYVLSYMYNMKQSQSKVKEITK